MVLVLLFALGAVSVVSCSNDKCRTVNCANGGVCAEGACTCSPGYQGPLCESRSRDRYIKTWTVWDSGSIAPIMIYNVIVSSDSLLTNVKIQNLYNYFTLSINGTVNNIDDSLVIPVQTLMARQVQGKGGYDTSARFYLYYAVKDVVGGLPDFRTMRSL